MDAISRKHLVMRTGALPAPKESSVLETLWSKQTMYPQGNKGQSQVDPLMF